MGLVHHSELILGGVRSGKSRQALLRTKEWPGPAAFIATAEPVDVAMQARIARHRAERPANWTTIEEPFDVLGACRRLRGRYHVALVDCLTLWVSNRLVRGDDGDALVAEALELGKLMDERRLSLVVVSNEVGEGVHPATSLGLRFSEVMGAVNQRVAAAAHVVTLMVAGLPHAIKDIRAPIAPANAPQAP